MNKTDTPTYQKIMLPLRVTSELYNKMIEKVQDKKKEKRGYSLNEYITDLIAKDLDGKK